MACAIASEIMNRFLKGNQGTLQEDVAAWFDNPALVSTCPSCTEITTGHGRIEERTCRVAEASWLVNRHEGKNGGWAGLSTIAQITAVRTDKKTGATTTEKRLYIPNKPSACRGDDREFMGIWCGIKFYSVLVTGA